MPRVTIPSLSPVQAARLDELTRVLGANGALAFLLQQAPEEAVEAVERKITVSPSTLTAVDAAADRAGLTRAGLIRLVLDRGAGVP